MLIYRHNMNPLKLLFFTSLVGLITAFPSGAPANICGRYVPGGHRNLGTPVASGPRTGPYKVEATPNGNGQFTVTLQSTTTLPFAGYVIQAVPSWKQLPDGPSDIVGSFQPDFQNGQYQVRSCGPMGGSNVLTHTSGVNKTRVSATWQAPRNLPDPNVKFIATVVQNFDNFYVAHSSPVNVQGGSTVGGQGGAGSFNSGTGSSGQGSFTSGGQGFSTIGSGFSPGTSGQSQMGSSSFFGSSTPGAGTTAFGGSSSNTGADNNAPLGGGISVISDAPEPVQLFSPDPPPPIVLPNGKISVHSFDSTAQSVPITTQNTSFTSSTFTISSNSGQQSPISPTISSSSLVSSNDQTFEVSPTSSSTTFTSWVSSSAENTAISSPTLSSLPPVTSAIDPKSSSLKVTVSETTSEAQGSSATGSSFSPVGDLTLETLLSKPSSTDVSASLSSTDAGHSVVPSLNIIDISTTNFITDSATNKPFDRTNILADLSSPVNIEIPPTRPSDPTINIIEIPILPEGKTAALINITNGQVKPSSVRRLNGIERFIGPGLSNRRRSSVGSTQGQSGMGQGQTGMGQGQMTSTFGQTRPPFTAMGNQFNGFSSSFGRPTGSQLSGPSGMASGGMFGPRFSGAGSFGGRSFGVSGFPGSRPMGPFGASGPGMMPGTGGMSFGPGSTGGSSIGGQTTFGQDSGTSSFGMPGGQTTSLGGTSSFGGQSSMFGGQGGSPFGGQTMMGGPFGPQFGGGSFGGPGPFGASGPGMFRGRPLGPFGQGSAFTGSLGSGSPAGSFGMGNAGQTGFGGSGSPFGGSSGQTFNSFASSGTTGTFGGSFGSPSSSGATGSFGTQFGPGISQGQGQTGSQGQSNSQNMFSPQGPTGAGTQLSGGSMGFSGFGPGTSNSGTGSGSTQTFGATGQGSSGLSSFGFSG